MELHYTVKALGATTPLYTSDSLIQACNMQVRWQSRLPHCDVAAVDNTTGEIVKMRGYDATSNNNKCPYGTDSNGNAPCDNGALCDRCMVGL